MKTTETTHLALRALREAAGQSAEHEALFERVMERIYRFFYKTVWDANEAEELAQRTLLLLEKSLREQAYDPKYSFNTWLWLKAHTVFAQWCRERERRPRRLDDAPEERLCDRRATNKSVDDRLDAATVLREVQRRLGDESYEIVCLHFEGGLLQKEIAELLGCDRRTVAARLKEAQTLIRTMLDR